MCSMQVVSGKGDQEAASWTSPGAPSVAGKPGQGSAVTQNSSGTPVPTSLPSACLESNASATSRGETAPRADTEPSSSSGLHGPPRELRGEAHPRAAPLLRMRQSAEQEAARAASLPPGRRGNGLVGWGGGRAAPAAISAASCSLRPRRHGNGVTQLGRLSARLARVTPAARAPSSPSRTLPGARGRQGGRLMGDAY